MQKPVLTCLLLCLSIPLSVHSQRMATGRVKPTPAKERMDGLAAREAASARSLVANLPLRSAGPSVMSGRVTDIEVSPSDPTRFYVAYASGGLWETTNNGQSFSPLFDQEASMTIGDIAVDWTHGETIWVGTGESNSSRSSYAGTGIYKSMDGGKSWRHLGLAETHHTGRIILHPDSPDIAWVGAIGHLFSSGPDRGVYKTTDGGRNWTRVLYVDDNTGCIDLVMHPGQPSTLYAAMWHRQRRAWNFIEGGTTSSIYKSTDGGITWDNITKGDNGFPAGKGVGRIGLSIFPGDPSVLYALLDNQFRREPEPEKPGPFRLTKDTLRTMTREAFLALSDTVIGEYLEENGFPREYSAERVRGMVAADSIRPSALAEYLEDSNSLLFDTDVTGAEVYRSEDGGRTWKKMNADYLDRVYNTYGYYFGLIRVSPADRNKIYIGGVPMLRSLDGGVTFEPINADNMHVDHHALWVSPDRDGHLVIGNDGGINLSYDDGETYYKANSPPVGQFYTIQVDMDKPYNIYGGLQDNGVWTGPSGYTAGPAWHSTGRYPWKWILGGDGMQIMVDGRDNNTVYTGYQFGFYFRIDKSTGSMKSIRPVHRLGERPLRFNWQTPIWLSAHNQDILYMGSNKFHRSMNRGDDFTELTGDLTRGGRKGDVAYGTLTTIHESPLRFGLIYTGTDDGLVHVSRDAGYTWKNISRGLPPDFWIRRVVASAFDTATVYACLNGHTWDHFGSYLYTSTNYGRSWKRIGLDLPAEPVNVVREDPVNRDLLYVGTDHGLYISLNRGKSFMRMDNGIPAAPVHDLVIHPRDRELAVATHGRSIFVADVSPLQQMTDTLVEKPLHVFHPGKVTWSRHWGRQAASWQEANEPESKFCYYTGTPGMVTMTLLSDSGLTLWQTRDTAEAGLNFVSCDLSVDSAMADAYRSERENGEGPVEADNGRYYLLPGSYTLLAENQDGLRAKAVLEIRKKKKD